ncbi:MAG: hypothetical protein Q8L87_00675 [Anaerolineales bacterium]|nr:hypothetical protein [Anaerolineales bacterium]
MSTPIQSNIPAQKRSIHYLVWLIPLLAIGALIFLILLYYGGGFLLTRQVSNLYSERDCASLIHSAEYVERFYPSKIASFTDPARVQAIECAAYLKADSLREKKDWKAAHEAYLAYQSAYPDGIYAAEARDFAADALFEMASEQRRRQDFSGAVDNLTALLDKFGNTPAISKTKAALPEVYLEWGLECRVEEEFAEAETVYLSLITWAEQDEEQTYVERGQTELAQNYFDWGMDLQSNKDFSQASSRFDKAITTDPNPDSTNSIAAKTRAHLPGFQRSWGMYLISQGKYAESIAHYENSVKLSLPQDVGSAKDALSQAYLNWAEALRAKEDFQQALEKIKDAGNSGATENSKKNSEDARADTLDLFSISKGTQAQKIITDATNSICKNGKPLETLPIIGTLDEKRLRLSGVNLTLPGNVLAQTPGNLHFIACAGEKEVTLQNCPYSRSGYGTITHWIKRIRYEWQIKIYNSQTGKLVNQKTFQGSAPQYCPARYSFGLSSTVYFRGDKPTTPTVTDWLATQLK